MSDVPLPGLAERLRQARALAPGRLSARHLDEIADIARGYTSMIENGERTNIGAQVAAGLSTALGVSLDWLVLGEGEAPTEEAVRVAVEIAEARFQAKKATGTDGE